MDVLLSVLRDLYMFAFKYHFGFSSGTTATGPQATTLTTSNTDTQTKEMPLLLPEIDVQPVGLLPEPPEEPTISATDEISFEGVGYAYVPETALFALPTRSFDGVIKRLPYGTSFQILNTQGKWCNVLVGDIRGWVHRDDITESNVQLTPQFVVGRRYDADEANTIKLRTLINDEFHAGALGLPLQDVEFVSFKLERKGRGIDWPNARPRIAGTWQRLLKGVRGVHLGVNPKTGAVMEYVNEDNTGHVAYVDSVYPDGAVTISEIGYPEEGKYAERTLHMEEWKELRPVFIEVS